MTGHGDRDALAAAGRLLADGRYGEAAETLLDVHRAGAAEPESAVGQIVAAAREVCLACLDHRTLTEQARAALDDAVRSEGLQRTRAQALLSLAATAARPREERHRGDNRRLLVRCLGPLEAEWEGAERPLAWPSRRGKTLFKYLVLQRDRRASREALMALLWPDADPAAARRNLNVTVHGLRRSMSDSSGRSCVRFRDGAYVLDPGLDAWVDVDEFGRLAASARRSARAGDASGFLSAARAAEALYRGDLFEDDLYDDWLDGRRRELRDDHLDLLEALGECHLEGSDHTACAEACHAVLADEPERETAHRRLMRCYARQGRRHLALRQYERCIAALRRALDVPPDAETLSLVARIRRGDPV